MKKRGVDRAITFAGGVTKLSELIGTSRQLVGQWKRLGRIPADWCPKVERLTGIRCEALNPAIEWQVLRGTK